jgi:hypothetical protein
VSLLKVLFGLAYKQSQIFLRSDIIEESAISYFRNAIGNWALEKTVTALWNSVMVNNSKRH